MSEDAKNNEGIVEFSEKTVEERIRDFGELLKSIESLDDKKRQLWREIYENAISDRQNSYVMFTKLVRLVQDKSTEHAVHGKTIATFLERMSRANDQLIKLAELIAKAQKGDEPEVVYELVKAVRVAVPAHIPVSAKMRLGYMDRNFMLENAHAIEDAGAAWVTVHARTKADGYTPPAFWDQLRPIREALKINVIANGEIWNNADAKQCRLESGCEDLMIGRGAVTTPDLTQCIRQNSDLPLLSWQDLLQLQIRFIHGPLS